jgi:hypothetical protein
MEKAAIAYTVFLVFLVLSVIGTILAIVMIPNALIPTLISGGSGALFMFGLAMLSKGIADIGADIAYIKKQSTSQSYPTPNRSPVPQQAQSNTQTQSDRWVCSHCSTKVRGSNTCPTCNEPRIS